MKNKTNFVFCCSSSFMILENDNRRFAVMPELPPKEKTCGNCGHVNIYRTVCKKCDKDLCCSYRPKEVNK